MIKNSSSYHSLPQVFSKAIPSQNALNNNTSRLSTSKSDPFENMKFSENKRPSLRPILNKHKKNASAESLFKSRSDSTESSIINPKNQGLPNIFKLSQISNNNILPAVKQVQKKHVFTERNEVATPFFRQNIQSICSSLERFSKKDYGIKQKSRPKFFDNIKRRKIQAEKIIETFEATLGSGFNYH